MFLLNVLLTFPNFTVHLMPKTAAAEDYIRSLASPLKRRQKAEFACDKCSRSRLRVSFCRFQLADFILS